MSQSLGYWPSRETILAQAALAVVYISGAVYMFVLRPRRQRSHAVGGGTGASGPAGATGSASVPDALPTGS